MFTDGESIENWGIYYNVDGMYEIVEVTIYPPGVEIYKPYVNRRYKKLFDVYVSLYKEMSRDHYSHHDSGSWFRRVKMVDYNDTYNIDIIKLDDIIPEFFI